jgi:hypothetical protein
MKRRATGLGQLLTDAATSYVKEQLADPNGCPCVACKFSRLMETVSANVQHARTNPGESAGRLARQVATSVQAAAERHAKTNPQARSIAEAIKTAQHTADFMQNRHQAPPIRRGNLVRQADGTYRAE